MLTVTDLLFFTGLTMWITGYIGISTIVLSRGTDEAPSIYAILMLVLAPYLVQAGWLTVAGTIIYKAVGW